MIKKHLSVKKGLMKVSNKSYSSKRLLSKSRNAVSVSSPSQNENKRHEYCVGCKCKVDIINIKKNNIKGKGGILRPCITGECVKGHKWARFVKNNNNTSSKSMKGGARAYVGAYVGAYASASVPFKKRKHYATIEDFINAQKDGITQRTLIPRTTTLFDRGDGSTFKTALDGFVNTWRKQGHWIWYIIPSLSPPKSDDKYTSHTTLFFSLGNGNGNTDENILTPEKYIEEPNLFINYVTIINAIYDALKEEKNKTKLKYVLKEDVDYNKLCNSLQIFRDIVVLKLEQDKQLDYIKSIEKINTLSTICGVFSKKQPQQPPPQRQKQCR